MQSSHRKLHQMEENYKKKQGTLNKLVNATGTPLVFIPREPEFSYMFQNTLSDPEKEQTF
jgi:hypothetical protein